MIYYEVKMQVKFLDIWYYFVLIAAISYLFGCFNFALFISKMKKKDVRTLGSGNPGTMNMSRQFGLKIGLLTLVLDMLKGGVPVLIVFFCFKNIYFIGNNIPVYLLACYTSGIFAIIGHIFPITMHFKGGKGIATTFGVFTFALACQNLWYLFLVVSILSITVLFIWLTKWGGIGSLLGVSLFTSAQILIVYFNYTTQIQNWSFICLYILLLWNIFLTFFAHRKNIQAVLIGEERKTLAKKEKSQIKS